VNITPNNIGAVARNAELLTTNPFAPTVLKGPYISKIDDALYVAHKRWNVTATNISGSISTLFDGSYESSIQIGNDKTAVITMDFSTEPNGYFPGYPYGYFLISFYYICAPKSVSGRVYCNYSSHGVGWHDITFTRVGDATALGAVTYRGYNSYYAISKVEISIVGDGSNSYGYTAVSEIELHLDRPSSNRNPFLSKYSPETLYYDLTAPNFIGNLSGNATSATTAATADKLTTGRTITLSGSVTGSTTFDGSGNVTIATTTNHTHNYAGSSSAGGSANAVAGEAGSVNKDRHVWFSDSATETKRNYDDDFKYNPSTNVLTVGSITGNAATATKWASAQTVYVALGTASKTTSIQGGSSSAATIGVDGVLGVGNGGTGAASFTANSVIMSGSTTTGAFTTRAVTNNTSASAVTANTNLITANTLAYWTGSSNLTTCKQGTLGAAATYSATTSVTSGSSALVTSGGVSSALGNYVTLSTAQTISGAKTFSAVTSITNTTASTSKSTGALKVSGGVGVAGQMSANKVMVGDAVVLQFNTSTNSLDFVFN